MRLKEPAFGRGGKPLELIDSSLYGVYTDPSKPPVIGDLAGVQQGPRSVVALTLPVTGCTERCGDITMRREPPPSCSSLLALWVQRRP